MIVTGGYWIIGDPADSKDEIKGTTSGLQKIPEAGWQFYDGAEASWQFYGEVEWTEDPFLTVVGKYSLPIC